MKIDSVLSRAGGYRRTDQIINSMPNATPPWMYVAAIAGIAAVLHVLSFLLIRRLPRLQASWAQRLTAALQLRPGQRMSELVWLHWSLVFLLWCAAGVMSLQALGMQRVASDVLSRLASAGFNVAGINVVPVRVVFGVMLAVALISVARMLRVLIERRLVKVRQFDTSTSESVATILGYIGFSLAVLIGLSAAGVNLTNLAIVAGALSVGIGFGLQAIVNNFVSGLILLSERPVRRGDYVRVGTVEGEVRKIHIRATEIETLDRVSVVVPNSELISSAVYNWRLRDPFIRVVISVGVAYGSDTELVRDLLVTVGLAHEATLPKATPGVPDTHAYFVGFGDSSLDFELRTYIRDVNLRGRVGSDLRFAIDKAFRENGVVIPFPQRDVWMKGDVGKD